MSQSSCLSQASTIPYEIVDHQDTEFVEDLVEVEKLYFPSDSQCNDAVDLACLTGVESPSDISADVHDLSELCCGINFESDSDEESPLSFEHSHSDRQEYLLQSKFKESGCGCKSLHNKPCSDVIDFHSIIDHRDHCRELSHDELDLVIKAQLLAHRFNGQHTQAKKHKSKEREKAHQKYYFNGLQVCRHTFCFAHGIERKKTASHSHLS